MTFELLPVGMVPAWVVLDAEGKPLFEYDNPFDADQRADVFTGSHVHYQGPGQPGACGDPMCPGWAIFNKGELFELGEIQRCDQCDLFGDDDAAASAARSIGHEVELRCLCPNNECRPGDIWDIDECAHLTEIVTFGPDESGSPIPEYGDGYENCYEGSSPIHGREAALEAARNVVAECELTGGYITVRPFIQELKSKLAEIHEAPYSCRDCGQEFGDREARWRWEVTSEPGEAGTP